MSDLLKGVALVTGAGSGKSLFPALYFSAQNAKGIGRATCVALVQHGIERLAMLDINVTGLRETRRLLEDIREVNILELQVDLAQEHSIISGVQRATDQFGRIDILINNAAVAGALLPSTDVATDDFSQSHRY